jgi:2',3'-cyclic-nucleotide 2'-phosphodiesterase (5'-nucleotidase family)
VLVLEAGNALFRVPGVPDDAAKQRAAFILKMLGQLGTAALAPGPRDMAAGRELLATEAAKAHVRVLSANLVAADKKGLFPASAVLSAGGLQVGVVGVSAPSIHGAQPPVAAALAEAKKLRPKVDVVLVLAAMPYGDALQLATEAGDAVDFILQSGDSRGQGVAQKQGTAYVVPTGERGRAVARLKVTVAGRGPLTDLSQLERDRQTLTLLDNQLADARKRVDATDGGVQQAWRQTLTTLEQRRRDVEKGLAASTAKPPRSFSFGFVTLDPSVKDDVEIKALVDRVEPGH